MSDTPVTAKMPPMVFFPGFNPQTDAGLFDHGADLIINTVNCKGTSKNSRGVAGQVFTRYPAAHDAYMAQCRAGRMFPGGVQLVEMNRNGEPEAGGGMWVANVATKDDWRDKSRLEWVESIAGKLEKIADRTGARRFAIPPMGCGEGGLDWNAQVGPVLRPHLEALAARGVETLVFAQDPQASRGLAWSVASDQNRKGSSVVPKLEGSAQPTRPSSEVAEVAPVVLQEPDRTVAWYAGIGARPLSEKNPTGVPPGVARKMEAVGEALAHKGWGLRSGHADGSDRAFEDGAARVPGAKMNIFLPEDGFKGARHDGVRFFARFDSETSAKAEALARKNHPAGARLQGFALAAMSRNGFQVLGQDLATPAMLAILYTQDGKEVGGTGQAIRLCKKAGVPVLNLGDPAWRGATVDDIVGAAEAVRAGKSLEAPARPKARSGDAR